MHCFVIYSPRFVTALYIRCFTPYSGIFHLYDGDQCYKVGGNLRNPRPWTGWLVYSRVALSTLALFSVDGHSHAIGRQICILWWKASNVKWIKEILPKTVQKYDYLSDKKTGEMEGLEALLWMRSAKAEDSLHARGIGNQLQYGCVLLVNSQIFK